MRPYEQDAKSSSLDAIQAREASMAQAAGEAALTARRVPRVNLRLLQGMASLPDNSFMERRQAQLDAENEPPRAA